MRISDWSSDVCSSDLVEETECQRTQEVQVEVSSDGGQTYQGIVVQEYTFSTRGATFQREDQRLPPRKVTDRKSVVSGKSVTVRVDLGGRRIIKKKIKEHDASMLKLIIK